MFQELTKENIVLIYLDDLIIPAKEECLVNLRRMLEVAGQYGLRMN